MNPIYRRFELITTDKEQEKAFHALLKQKGLTREDLMLILESVKLREFDHSSAID